MNVDAILTRLEHVHRYGKGWRADCPNGHRSRGTLSIAEGDNGTVLLKCFAGCEPAHVLAAIGLTVADLFPPRANLRDLAPAERSALREAAKHAGWRAALAVLDREAVVVAIAAGHTSRGLSLEGSDVDRLNQACERIADAREVLRA